MEREALKSAATITGPEPWRSKRWIAAHYGFSVRWVEARLAEGMPSVMIGGQRRMRVSETDPWLLGSGELG